jgi:hypothetical protein
VQSKGNDLFDGLKKAPSKDAVYHPSCVLFGGTKLLYLPIKRLVKHS